MHTVSTLPLGAWLNGLLAVGGALIVVAVLAIGVASWAGVELVCASGHDHPDERPAR